jgi:hypothetical protein
MLAPCEPELSDLLSTTWLSRLAMLSPLRYVLSPSYKRYSANRGLKIYRTPDKPLYRTGNKVLLGILAFNIVLFVATKAYYVVINK